MRVFLSYAHEPPPNAALVDRIRTRLEQSGIETWIDSYNLLDGDQWRQQILEGVLASDHTIAFLSKQAMRQGRVCIDELNMALHVQAAVVPVLIEPKDSFVVPPRFGEFQWIDMSAWPSGDNAWFEAKIADLIRVLQDPNHKARKAEIDVLRRVLQPVEQADLIQEKVSGFVGRTWARDALNQRRVSEPAENLTWVTGGPGTGKSAFAAWFASMDRSHVVAVHFCEMGIHLRNDPVRIVRTIAFQIARRLGDYRVQLLQVLSRMIPSPGAVDAPLSTISTNLPAIVAALDNTLAEVLFDLLLAEPLATCIDGGRRGDPYLILIDGLDETIVDGTSSVAELLRIRAPKLPRWIGIVALSREERPIQAVFGHLTQLRLDSGDEHAEDLKHYTRDWLGPDSDTLIDRIVAASEGAFLYLTLLREAIASGVMSLDKPEGLPRGLPGIYHRWFRSRFPDKTVYAEEILPIISVLIAASQPVPLDFLAKMFAWNAREQARTTQRLGTLFPVRGHVIRPFHPSLRDWLVSDNPLVAASPDYIVDEADGVFRLSAALWPWFITFLTGTGAFREATPFELTEFPKIAMRQTALSLKSRVDFLSPQVDVEDALLKMAEMAIGFNAWTPARDWLKLSKHVGQMLGSNGLSLVAFSESMLGGLELRLGNLKKAEEAFARCMAVSEEWIGSGSPELTRYKGTIQGYLGISEVRKDQGDWKSALHALTQAGNILDRIVAAQPSDLASWNNLITVYDGIGNIAMAQGDLPEALAAFDTAMDISRSLASFEPKRSWWRTRILSGHHSIGDVKMGMGDLAGAHAEYDAAIMISQEGVKTHANNIHWIEHLQISYEKMGDVKLAQDDATGALTDFESMLELSMLITKADPVNTDRQRNLAVNFQKLGDAKMALDDFHGALAALEAGRQVISKLASLDSSNNLWQRSLAIFEERMGAVKMELHRYPDAFADFEASMERRQDILLSELSNRQWQRDLLISYQKMGEAKRFSGDYLSALDMLSASKEIGLSLASANPNNMMWQRDLLRNYSQVGDVKLEQGDLSGAEEAIYDCIEIADRWTKSDREGKEWRQSIARAHYKLGMLAEAAGDKARLDEETRLVKDALNGMTFELDVNTATTWGTFLSKVRR